MVTMFHHIIENGTKKKLYFHILGILQWTYALPSFVSSCNITYTFIIIFKIQFQFSINKMSQRSKGKLFHVDNEDKSSLIHSWPFTCRICHYNDLFPIASTLSIDATRRRFRRCNESRWTSNPMRSRGSWLFCSRRCRCKTVRWRR